jgi:hypothetical protein
MSTTEPARGQRRSRSRIATPQTRLRQSGNRHRTAEAAAQIHSEIHRSTDSEGQAEVIVIEGLWSCV